MVAAALRNELGGGHTFDFVEGVVPCPRATGTSFDHFSAKGS